MYTVCALLPLGCSRSPPDYNVDLFFLFFFFFVFFFFRLSDDSPGPLSRPLSAAGFIISIFVSSYFRSIIAGRFSSNLCSVFDTNIFLYFYFFNKFLYRSRLWCDGGVSRARADNKLKGGDTRTVPRGVASKYIPFPSPLPRASGRIFVGAKNTDVAGTRHSIGRHFLSDNRPTRLFV